MTNPQGPQGNPGDILNWPMLKIKYRTDPAKLAAILPPGITPGKDPVVTITIYNFPVQNEPELGYVLNVAADYNGVAGDYTIALGIDQEAPLFLCQELWGQPKYPVTTHYYRLMDHIEAKVIHQGTTFIEFSGDVVETLPNPEDHDEHEWWIKCIRSVDMQPETYDFPPHVVDVHTEYGTAFLQELKGEVILRDSAWDPIASKLPMLEQISARLWTPIFKGRSITKAGQLDGKAYWPFADTISGTRWIGEGGAPKKG